MRVIICFLNFILLTLKSVINLLVYRHTIGKGCTEAYWDYKFAMDNLENTTETLKHIKVIELIADKNIVLKRKLLTNLKIVLY